jgi:hypothetical protein
LRTVVEEASPECRAGTRAVYRADVAVQRSFFAQLSNDYLTGRILPVMLA